MMGLVAAVVAIVILVFFGLGYLFGRLFLTTAALDCRNPDARRPLRNNKRRAEPRRQPGDPVPGRALVGARRAGRTSTPGNCRDGFLVLCATVCSLIFPFVGTIVYSILRPPSSSPTSASASWRSGPRSCACASWRSSRVRATAPDRRTFLRCPNCRARIKDPCETCGKPIDPRWSICPYCETPVHRAPPERRPQPSAAVGVFSRPASQPAARSPRHPWRRRSRARRAVAPGSRGAAAATAARAPSSGDSAASRRAPTPHRRASRPGRGRAAPRRRRLSSGRPRRGSPSAAASRLPRRWRTPRP